MISRLVDEYLCKSVTYVHENQLYVWMYQHTLLVNISKHTLIFTLLTFLISLFGLEKTHLKESADLSTFHPVTSNLRPLDQNNVCAISSTYFEVCLFYLYCRTCIDHGPHSVTLSLHGCLRKYMLPLKKCYVNEPAMIDTEIPSRFPAPTPQPQTLKTHISEIWTDVR